MKKIIAFSIILSGLFSIGIVTAYTITYSDSCKVKMPLGQSPLFNSDLIHSKNYQELSASVTCGISEPYSDLTELKRDVTIGGNNG